MAVGSLDLIRAVSRRPTHHRTKECGLMVDQALDVDPVEVGLEPWRGENPVVEDATIWWTLNLPYLSIRFSVTRED